MDLVLVAARIALAGVFLVAGISKLIDRARWRRALSDFGVPSSLVAAAEITLPLFEIATAAALLPDATHTWGAMAALALLLTFTAAIGLSLARGRRPNCRCFGGLHSAEVDWRMMIRNLLLAALAGVVAADLVVPLPDSISGPVVAGVGATLLVLVIIAGSWLTYHLLRQQGRLLLRVEALESAIAHAGLPVTGTRLPDTSQVHGPRIGSTAPDFSLPTADGRRISLQNLRKSGQHVLLVFALPNCDPCHRILDEVADWEASSPLRIVAITPRVENSRSQQVDPLLVDEGGEVAQFFGIDSWPSAVLIEPEGTIRSAPAQGPIAIRQLQASITPASVATR